MNTGLYKLWDQSFRQKCQHYLQCNPHLNRHLRNYQLKKKKRLEQDQLRRDRKRTGRRSTILTGPMGVEEEAEIGKKTLLGE